MTGPGERGRQPQWSERRDCLGSENDTEPGHSQAETALSCRPGVDQRRRETARSGQVPPPLDCWRAQEVWRETNMDRRPLY